jgi:RNA polymerase sigma factor (sigma-70 family)
VLTELYQAVQPLMAAAFARYRQESGDQARRLPTTLEQSDLAQESWVILADLAERWRPTGGSFAAYFRVTFPWTLARYVRRNSPSRRAKGVVVFGAEQPAVQERLDDCPGADDGREWDGDLAWNEHLEHLSERERAVLMLHLAGQKPFTAVAKALRMTRPAAYRLYRRALRRVRAAPTRAGSHPVEPGPAGPYCTSGRSSAPRYEDGLVALVLALHAGARRSRLIPGRASLAERAGLSERRVERLLSILLEAGCLRSRGPRRPRQLVHSTPAATLAALARASGQG